VPDRLPIDKQEFWKRRLDSALASGAIHTSIYDVSYDTWCRIQTIHQAILPRLLQGYRNPRILDCGCGYGALLDILPREGFTYLGVDISPDLVSLARTRHPDRQFFQADLRHLSLAQRSFDVAIARSVEGMVKDNLGVAEWRAMEKEILRVADRLILLNYSVPDVYTVYDATPPLLTSCRICTTGGVLVYRYGQSGTCELYDLFVEEDYRRQGVATRLIGQLLDGLDGETVYAFTRADNHAALSLYRSLGFAVIPVGGLYLGSDACIATRAARRV
jgi:SAM-dependent methyltransferase